MKKRNLKEIPLHFIVGLGRSGTTLITSLLNRHPQVLSAPESKFILYCYQRYHKKTSFTREEVDELIDAIFSLNEARFVSLKFWFINKEELRKSIYSYLPDLSFPDLCKLVYLNSFLGNKKEDVKVIVDKNPPYTLHIGKIMKLYPTGKFIALTRDYRDNAISRQAFQLDSINSIIYHGIVWNEFNRQLLKAQKKFPQKILLIRYEDLVANPDENFIKICNFLGIDTSISISGSQDDYKEYFDKILSVLTPEQGKLFMQMHGRIINKVDKSKIGVWKSQLPPHYISCLNQLCGKTGKILGYETNGDISSGVSLKTRLAIFIQYLFRKAESFVHRNYYHSPFWLRKSAKKIKIAIGRMKPNNK